MNRNQQNDQYISSGREVRYDAFISYHPTDSEWVFEWLLPKLRAAGLVIAIDEETFAPGAPLLAEVERSISESKFTLAILSPEWVNNHWDNFEALLVQYTDPGARFRRLIPILLKPCKPPKRIQLLHWVDFTEESRSEQQVQRIISAIQGVSVLPELRPDLAHPDARQRWWEFRWLLSVGTIAVATLSILLWWIWMQRPPKQLDEANFGIAVSEFLVVDEEDTPIKDDIGRIQAQRIAGFIDLQRDELAEVIRRPVEVWGSERVIKAVHEGEEAIRASELGAEVLIYGTIKRDLGEWEVSPEFYLTEDAVGRADELIGKYALGTPISFEKDNYASEGSFTSAMRARTRSLVLMIQGLSHYSSGQTDDYLEAAEIFQEAAADPEWGTSAHKSGQEILYLFLGNAYLKVGSLAEDSDTRIDYFQKSQNAYAEALDYNPKYPRIHNGLGNLYFQMAQLYEFERDNCADDWDWASMAKAEDAFGKALSAPSSSKPQSGNVDLRANLGLGRIYYFYGLCLSDQISPQEWVKAKEHHKNVLQEYDSQPESYLKLLASAALLDLGDMALKEAQWRYYADESDPLIARQYENAIQYYLDAIKIFDKIKTAEEIRHAAIIEIKLLNGMCFFGETGEAESNFERFVEDTKIPQDAVELITEYTKEQCGL